MRRRLAPRSIAAGLCLCLFAAPPARADSLKLEKIVLLMRHGVRPPTHEPALDPAIAPDPWPTWPVPDGDLTPHGAQAIALLAAYDRALFVKSGLLPATGCPAPGAVSIHADVDERTLKTGAAYAAALAPGCALVVDHAAGSKDKLFSPLDGGDPAFDAQAARAQMQAAAGGDIAALITAHHALFAKMQSVLAPGGNAFLNLPATLTIKDPHKIPRLGGPLAEGASAAEDFLLEYLEGKNLGEVGWGRVTEPDIAALLALHPLAYTITARPPAIAAATATPLARAIAAALAGPAKVTILVGHDTNIADLGGLLGLHWHLGGYPADDPPPGGGLLVSLWQGAEGQHYVTIAYQVQTMDQIRNLAPLGPANPPATQPLAIPGCGNDIAPTACTLSAFRKLVGAP